MISNGVHRFEFLGRDFSLRIRPAFWLLSLGGRIVKRSMFGNPSSTEGGAMVWWQPKDGYLCGVKVSSRGLHVTTPWGQWPKPVDVELGDRT